MKKILFTLFSVLAISCAKINPPTFVPLTYGAIGVTDSCIYLLSTIDDTDTIKVVDFLQRLRSNDKGMYIVSPKMLKNPRFIFDYGSGTLFDGKIHCNYGVDFDFVAKSGEEYLYFVPWPNIKSVFTGLKQVRLYYDDEKYKNEQYFEPEEIKQYFDFLSAHMMSNK